MKNIVALLKRLLPSFLSLEQALLLFPVAVTVLVAVALLFGGVVAPWQWYVGLGIGIIPLLYRKSIKRALVSLLLLSFVLLMVYVGAHIFPDRTGYDCIVS